MKTQTLRQMRNELYISEKLTAFVCLVAARIEINIGMKQNLEC
jgi:hypothetical protein